MSAKSPAERKRLERQRLRSQGVTVVRFKLSNTQRVNLGRLCNETVRPGDAPFTYDELITRLIDKESKLLDSKLEKLKQSNCTRCHQQLPANCNRLFYGDVDCYLTKDCKALYP